MTGDFQEAGAQNTSDFGNLPPTSFGRMLDAYESGELAVISRVVNEELTYDYIETSLGEMRDHLQINGHPYDMVNAALVLRGTIINQFVNHYGTDTLIAHSGITQQTLDSAIAEKIAFTTIAAFGSVLPRGNQLEALISETARRWYVDHLLNGSIEIAGYKSKEILGFGSELKVAEMLINILGSYDIKFRDRHELAQLRIDNDALFENTRILQKYRIKPALVRGSGAGRINDWMVLDWEKMRAEMRQVGGLVESDDFVFQDVLARFYGTVSEFIATEPVYERQGSGASTLLRLNFSRAIKGSKGASPELAVQLSSTGQLVGMRGTSLAAFADRVGLRDQYELLRGELLAIFCDLVVPAYLVDEVRDIEKSLAVERHGKPRAVETIRKLVLSRTRLIHQDPKRIERELHRENRKSPELHEVIGFIRPLPKGFRATAEARRLCKEELKKELAPAGETYVKTHNRGGRNTESEIEVSTGHRAIRRNIGGAVIRLTDE